ncbi:MAG: hypothetical protein Ct9H90mP19_4680 [Gammaproteobacteria bacterium]|nr:MAG: hypothetical protein Ct9H90mP19_4680 [Gammaproteobacteria bacterium]
MRLRIIETEEKKFFITTVPLDISPKSFEIKDKNLYILWPDDHKS